MVISERSSLHSRSRNFSEFLPVVKVIPIDSFLLQVHSSRPVKLSCPVQGKLYSCVLYSSLRTSLRVVSLVVQSCSCCTCTAIDRSPTPPPSTICTIVLSALILWAFFSSLASLRTYPHCFHLPIVGRNRNTSPYLFLYFILIHQPSE